MLRNKLLDPNNVLWGSVAFLTSRTASVPITSLELGSQVRVMTDCPPRVLGSYI